MTRPSSPTKRLEHVEKHHGQILETRVLTPSPGFAISCGIDLARYLGLIAILAWLLPPANESFKEPASTY